MTIMYYRLLNLIGCITSKILGPPPLGAVCPSPTQQKLVQGYIPDKTTNSGPKPSVISTDFTSAIAVTLHELYQVYEVKQYTKVAPNKPAKVMQYQVYEVEQHTKVAPNEPAKVMVNHAARARRGTGDLESDSLDCTGVVEHGIYVVHLASTEFSRERNASAGSDVEHVSRSTLVVLDRNGGEHIILTIATAMATST